MTKNDFDQMIFRAKNKAKDAGKWTLGMVRNTIDYAKNNPKDALAFVTLGTTAIGGVNKIFRSINRHRTLRQEKYHREREVYDRSLNMYLVTKRKLKKSDLDRINAYMRKTGKKKSEALSDLNLLKR